MIFELRRNLGCTSFYVFRNGKVFGVDTMRFYFFCAFFVSLHICLYRIVTFIAQEKQVSKEWRQKRAR